MLRITQIKILNILERRKILLTKIPNHPNKLAAKIQK
jgi:hypothetical protein